MVIVLSCLVARASSLSSRDVLMDSYDVVRGWMFVVRVAVVDSSLALS